MSDFRMQRAWHVSRAAVALACVGGIDAWVGARLRADPGNDAGFTEVPGEREFTGELMVRPRQDLTPAGRGEALIALDAFPNRRNARTDEYVIALGGPPLEPGAAERAVADTLMSTGLFQYACPNWRVFPTLVPNDPLFAQQWHHAMIESAGAWDLWRADGVAEVIVAVTDTGIVVHEDLPFRVPGFNCVTNLPETAGGNGVVAIEAPPYAAAAGRAPRRATGGRASLEGTEPCQSASNSSSRSLAALAPRCDLIRLMPLLRSQSVGRLRSDRRRPSLSRTWRFRASIWSWP